jgi:anthranilate synthase/phosphoribosyltransferase
VDTCGTGGDGLATFNISSLAALVVAGCGVRVAKHGNRGVSSPTGSADFFAALGVDTGLSPAQAAGLLQRAGFAFLFAPTYHGAMRHAAPVRAELGIKSVMNLLGPLVNPAEAEFQLIGVYDAALCEPVARAARLLGVRRVLVVHGRDGQDEVSVTGPTTMVEIGEDGRLVQREFGPESCGIACVSLDQLKGGSAADNAAAAHALLAGGGADGLRDAVALNAGAALYVCGVAADIEGGYRRARAALSDGSAAALLERVIATAAGLREKPAAAAGSG